MEVHSTVPPFGPRYLTTVVDVLVVLPPVALRTAFHGMEIAKFSNFEGIPHTSHNNSYTWTEILFKLVYVAPNNISQFTVIIGCTKEFI